MLNYFSFWFYPDFVLTPVAVVGGNCARSLAFLLAAAAVGAIFGSFATDIGEKVCI